MSKPFPLGGKLAKTVKVDGKEMILSRHDILTLQGSDYAGTWTLVYFDAGGAIFLQGDEILAILNDGTMGRKKFTDQDLDRLYKLTYLVFGT